MNDDKFNVLVMRDTTNVQRMRVHPLILRLGIVFLVLLFLCAGVGLYSGFYFWDVNKELTSKIYDMKRTIATTSIELKRLKNMELMNDEDSKKCIDSIIAISGENNTNNTIESRIDLNKILGNINKNILFSKNVQIKFSGNVMNISFDLHKIDHEDQNAIKGDVKMHLISVNGKMILLDPTKETFFEVRRMKQYRLRIPIPESCPKEDIFGIRITINHPPHETVFCETYPLSDILL